VQLFIIDELIVMSRWSVL